MEGKSGGNGAIPISLTVQAVRFILNALDEVQGSCPSTFLKIAGHTEDTVLRVQAEFEHACGANGARFARPANVVLSEASWRIIFNVNEAAIYSLGPLELETVAGCSLQAAAQVNLLICSSVWGAYGKGSWDSKMQATPTSAPAAALALANPPPVVPAPLSLAQTPTNLPTQVKATVAKTSKEKEPDDEWNTVKNSKRHNKQGRGGHRSRG